jgi:hypothetical protein
VVGARSAPALLKRSGPRLLIAIGGLIGAGGFVWQAQLTSSSGYLAGIAGPAILMCLGAGLIFTPAAAAATGAVGPTEAGLVSGLINTSRQVGGSLGLAALATVAAGPADPIAGFRHAFLIAAGLMLAVAVLSVILPRR